jgi:sulfotransferase
MKKYYFVSGLPRSGSTLLCNLLAQNPNFYSTPTSGCLDVLFNIRNFWDNLIEHKANIDKKDNENRKLAVLRGAFHSYYLTSRNVVFDKGRGWLAYLELLEYIIGDKVKVLVPVRDLREVLSSFEKLWRNQAKSSQLFLERDRYFDFQSVDGRCASWMNMDQPVGLALTRVRDALQRGFADRLFFVDYEQLTKSPKSTMSKIYNFLDEPSFQHNFEHVEQVTQEDDSIFGFENLHKISSRVEYKQPDYNTILSGPVADRYKGPYSWSNYI